MDQILTDWQILMSATERADVMGHRVRMKMRLLELERNPARAIQRVQRLLHESADTAGASALLTFITRTSVESILVGTLGAHRFQTFCEQFAVVSKMDYALAFFQSLMCMCIRTEIHDRFRADGGAKPALPPRKLLPDEVAHLDTNSTLASKVAEKASVMFVRVLMELVGRYAGVLDHLAVNPRLIGFQLRDLTAPEIRDTILDLLCVQAHKDPVALTWIVDEVTIWSID